MFIPIEEVKHVAKLARLELDSDELRAFQGELNALLGHFQEVNQDFYPSETFSPIVALQSIWVEDEATLELERDAAMQNAPITRAGLFVVPTIIED